MHVFPKLGRQALLFDLRSSPSSLFSQCEQVGGDSFLSYKTGRVSQSVRGWDGAIELPKKMRYLLEIAVEASKALAISGSMWIMQSCFAATFWLRIWSAFMTHWPKDLPMTVLAMLQMNWRGSRPQSCSSGR